MEKQKHRQESSIDKQVNNLFSSLDESPFDHEKLDVYGVELGFVAWLAAFLDDASNWSAQHRRELVEQLDRLSGLLNTAEGNGRRQGQQRAKFFKDARGSASDRAALP